MVWHLKPVNDIFVFILSVYTAAQTTIELIMLQAADPLVILSACHNYIRLVNAGNQRQRVYAVRLHGYG